MKRCAIYARVSTPGQREEKTIQAQLAELPAYAKSQGWTVIDVYKDEGISGGFVEGRADFKRLLKDMDRRKFEILLVTEHSRITGTEDPEELGMILGAMMRNEILLASPQEGCIDQKNFVGRFMAMAKFMFGAERRAEIARTLKRGKRNRLREGQYCQPHVPYGLKRETDRTVKPVKHTMLLHPEESKVLRMAYDMIVEQGKTMNWVAAHFNTLGLKSRKGKRWTPGMLQAVLRNRDTLTGTIISNRHAFKQIGNGRFEDLGENPESEWIKVKVPAVFTEAEYRKLDKRIQNNRTQGRPGISESAFLLRSQKVRCGECGKTYGPRWTAPKDRKPQKYYVCGGRVIQPKFLKEGERKCDGPYVNQQALDDEVWNNLVVRLFMFPKQTLKDWNKVVDIKQGALKSLEGRLSNTEKDIKAKEEQADRLLDEGISNLFPIEKIKEKKAAIDKALETLNGEKDRLEGEIRKIKRVQSNKEGMDRAVEELGKLGKRLSAKMNNMGMKDKQNLIEYFLTNGNYVEINKAHLTDEWDGHKWTWSLKGVFDLKGVLNALKVYDKTGAVPGYDSYLTDLNIRKYDNELNIYVPIAI